MKKIIISFLVVLALVFVVVLFYQRAVNAPGFLSASSSLIIKPGESSAQIANKLEKTGLVKSALFARFYFWQSGASKRLRAGEYELAPNLSLARIARKLTSGQIKNIEKQVLIKDGLTINLVDDALKEAGVIVNNNFLKLAKGKIKDLPAELKNYWFLVAAPSEATLEGFLFPDTYTFYTKEKAEVVLKKMLDNFDKQFTEKLKADIKLQKKTVFEVVTLASIIQKEVRSNKDMKLVAGVFYNRLANNQRLQSSATLDYIMGYHKEKHTVEDIELVSPYNTYASDGLPVGPIASPGRQAIEAAVYPTKTDYLFFLTRADNGETAFAKTLAEHNLNKAKYLK